MSSTEYNPEVCDGCSLCDPNEQYGKYTDYSELEEMQARAECAEARVRECDEKHDLSYEHAIHQVQMQAARIAALEGALRSIEQDCGDPIMEWRARAALAAGGPPPWFVCKGCGASGFGEHACPAPAPACTCPIKPGERGFGVSVFHAASCPVKP